MPSVPVREVLSFSVLEELSAAALAALKLMAALYKEENAHPCILYII